MIYTVTLNPARDRSVVINDFAAGKVNRISEVRDDPGGKGINVSKIIKALGGCSIAMGIVGGSTGRYIKTALDEMGIENDFAFTEAETRTNIKISDPINHRTTDINEPGAPMDLTAVQCVFDKLLASVDTGDTVVIAGKLDTTRVDIKNRIETIGKKGAKVFLDTEGEALTQGVCGSPYLIKPNELELSMLTGHKSHIISEIASGARELIKKHSINTVVVSLGEKGAVFADACSVFIAEGIKVTEVSTVGAGDTMLGALAYAFEQKMSTKDAFALSVAASAAAVTCPGTKCPEPELINELLKQVKITEL